MPETQASRTEKDKVWRRIEQIVGPMALAVGRRRKDWRETGDAELSIFMTFSASDPPWYDVNRDDLETWLSYPRAFVVFVIGKHTDVLVIPATDVHRLTQGLRTTRRGNVKLHLEHTLGGYRFREVAGPGSDLAPFHNKYSLLHSQADSG